MASSIREIKNIYFFSLMNHSVTCFSVTEWVFINYLVLSVILFGLRPNNTLLRSFSPVEKKMKSGRKSLLLGNKRINNQGLDRVFADLRIFETNSTHKI